MSDDTSLPESPAAVMAALRVLWPSTGHPSEASRQAAAARMQTLTALRTADATAHLADRIDANTERFMKAFTNLQRVMDERAKELTAATNHSAQQAKRLGQIGIWLTCAGVLLAAVEALGAGRTMGWW
jgi:hypothetical protein